MKFPTVEKLTLEKQCLGLIAILLTGEIVFVMALLFQLQSATDEAVVEARLNEILRRSQTMVFSFRDYLQSLESYVLKRSPESWKMVESSESKIRNESEWLASNLKETYPGLASRAGDLSGDYEKVFRVIKMMHQRIPSIPESRLPFFFMAVIQKVNPYRTSMERKSVSLLGEEEMLLDELPQKQKDTRERLRQIIIAGLAINALIVFALTIFFITRIGRRISRMVENTRMFSAGQPMLPCLTGNDELARLDASMHTMVEKIDAAQRQRQEFLAMVSHELRTPLNSVGGSLELLTMGTAGKLEGKALEFVEKSRADVEKLVELVNDLLDLEKLEAGRLSIVQKAVYLDDILDDAVESVADEAGRRGVSIDKRDESPSEVNADRARLKQVFAYLIKNALQASKTGSVIQVISRENAGMVEVEVKDSGCGVPEKLQATLFERFRQSPTVEGGILCGMGLPICRHLVRLHNGRITYAPNSDGGSIFKVELPCIAT